VTFTPDTLFYYTKLFTTMQMTSPSSLRHRDDDDESQASTDMSGHLSLNKKTKEKQEEIAEKESIGVNRLRFVVLMCLVASSIAVSLSVFIFFRRAEIKNFEVQFTSDAEKVLEAVGRTIDDTLGATDAFIVKLVTYAKYSNSTWPFVTMPSFALHASKVLELSEAIHVSVKPLVRADQRERWEEYSAKNDVWIQESLDIQENLEDWRHPIIREFNVTGLMTITGPSEDPFPYYENTYFPLWQQAPMLTGPLNPVPYNIDSWSIPSSVEGNLVTLTEKKVTIGNVFVGVIMDPTDVVGAYIADLALNWASNYIPEDEAYDEPGIQINVPVLDTVDAVRIDITDDSIPVVGMVTFTYYYRDFLRNILASNTEGIIVVTENVCQSQVFTYRLDGAETTYLGIGDLHDSKYDYLEVSSLVSDMVDNNDGHYTGPPLADDFCPKTLKIYPSKQLESEYITNKPIIFTCVVALTFLFTSTVFLCYDWLVSRRQGIVLGQARASGAIVRSLFPEKVRDQLYSEQKEDKRLHDKQSTQESSFDANGKAESSRANQGSRPIAELYDETTIIFMDLAGFTHWSSSRTPVEVFDLLEAVYGEFDKLAKRRGVFKIETIGDCYVAVTGIPQAQPDHALIMAKFGRDCLMKFNQVKHDLMGRLGADTEELDLRVGMHSGTTTGGVLRGDKGRFQLFGDTVNTASRMESNGVKGRIHCSQATADALILKGKGSWVIPREEKVMAKGKGEMQTYFIQFLPASADQNKILESSMRRTNSSAQLEADAQLDLPHSMPGISPDASSASSTASSVHEREQLS